MSNGTVWNPGETLQFYCDEGYQLQGQENLTCLNDSHWTSPVPVCIGKIYTYMQLAGFADVTSKVNIRL